MSAFGFNGGVQAVPSFSTTLSTSQNIGSGVRAAYFTSPADCGTITKLSVYSDRGSGSCHLIGVIYSNAAGKAGTLLASTPSIAVGSGAGWVDLTFSSGLVASPNTQYFLGVFVVDWATAAPKLGYNTAGAGTDLYSVSPDTGGPAATLNATPSIARDAAIIATYTPASSFIPQILAFG